MSATSEKTTPRPAPPPAGGAPFCSGEPPAFRLPPRERMDPGLLDRLEARFCLQHGLLPLHRVAGRVLVAWDGRAGAEEIALAEARLGPLRLVRADRSEIQDRLLACRRQSLIQAAELSLDSRYSCRDLRGLNLASLPSAGALGLLGLWLASPAISFTILFALAAAVVLMNTGLKLAAGLAALRAGPPRPRTISPEVLRHARRPAADALNRARLPTISILVPLLREQRIAGRLLQRLAALDYPRDRLEICLVVEERDSQTRACLARVALQPHLRVITVPHGSLRTKPRALNYALPLCRGSIIGIYDAEDAPESDQLRKVVQHFFSGGPELGCVQCALDYYNAGTNWLSRCFTIEYASWFRVVLPGLQRLGVPIPLGGTSLFLRRSVLERIGGWDAFNVTEDADLGMRLARQGFRTELADSTTREEANCRLWPWVRQRSRWLKGYAMTYLVHMRRPLALYRDLGPRRFLAFQALFLGALLGFTFAPILLSFWLLSFGLLHPTALHLSPEGLALLQFLFIATEAIALGVAALALRRRGGQGLMPWILTMHLYFPLATLAAVKAAYEMLFRPFYWDKTAHGIYDETPAQPLRSRKSA